MPHTEYFRDVIDRKPNLFNSDRVLWGNHARSNAAVQSFANNRAAFFTAFAKVRLCVWGRAAAGHGFTCSAHRVHTVHGCRANGQTARPRVPFPSSPLQAYNKMGRMGAVWQSYGAKLNA